MVRLGFPIILCWMQSLAYAGDDARPNIIVIMADDFGYECVRANGGESYENPNLDRLASEGIREHLKQLDIRDNTLLIFLGDNGTHPSITSRYQGRDYRGGKGTTTTRGTHVPLIVNWPALIRSGRVDASLISSVDILPTICEAAGIDPKSKLDGISFLPQLRNQPGQPRTWLYSWYSPRQQANLMVKEFVFDGEYKLYRTGEFYRLNEDLNEQRPVAATSLTPEEKEARATLQAALEQFTNARPLELDRVLGATAPKQPKKKAKKP